jgi:GNAT superfamily N-acetyltransferase
MLTTFYRKAIVMARPIDDTIPEVKPCLPIVITPLRDQDLPAYIQLRPDEDRNVIKRRLANGDQCFAVWHQGRILHAGWVTTKQKYESYLRRELILQRGDIFLYDHFTHPSFRRCGLARAREVHVLRHYREEGYRQSIAIIAIENKAAFLPFQAVGYHSIGMVKCLRFGPWQWDWEERWDEKLFPTLTRMKM